MDMYVNATETFKASNPGFTGVKIVKTALRYKKLVTDIMIFCRKLRGGVAQKVKRLTRNRSIRAPSKATAFSYSKKLYPLCSVLVGSRNGFEGQYPIELTKLRALYKVDKYVTLY